MPVPLPPPPESNPPTPPNPFVWLVICVIVMAGGAGYMLFTWPKSLPSGTILFWIRVVGFPAIASALLFGLRLLYFGREAGRLDAERKEWSDECAEATLFAQEPLAVLASGYLCAQGSFDVARAMLSGDRQLESHVSVAGAETVRHTTLRLIDDPILADRYASCLRELLAMIDDALRTVPESSPFGIHLHCHGNIEASELREIWQTCWMETGLRPVETSLIEKDEGVMTLDAWLDGYGGPALERYALFMALQLHETPLVNGAEAAVAMLLGWTPLVQRNGLPIQALLHRPVEQSGGTLRDALGKALLWGRAHAADVMDVWQTGLAPADKPALLDASSEIKLGASQTNELSGFHDIDLAIGHAGVADAWLAIALAAEHASQTGKPQAVATRQQDIRLAVVQPFRDLDAEEVQASIENGKEGNK